MKDGRCWGLYASIAAGVLSLAVSHAVAGVAIDPFVVVGTAKPLGPFGVEAAPGIPATLAWDGAGTYTVELRDPVLQTPIHQNAIAGFLQPAGDHVMGCVVHHGFFGESDLGPQAYLNLSGAQADDACDGSRHVEVVGVYLGAFLLELSN